MRTAALSLALAVAGAILGAWGVLAATDRTLTLPAEVPPTTSTSAVSPTAATTPVPAPAPPSEGVMLVWTPDRLPEGLAARVAELPDVEAVTEVRAGVVSLVESHAADGSQIEEAPDGYGVPLEAVAIDPAGFADVLATTAGQAERLGDDAALLSDASARLRRLGPGGSVTLAGGQRLTVVGVVGDRESGAAELIVSTEVGDRLGVTTPRYLILRFEGDRGSLEARIRDLLPDGVPARLRGPGETPYLRHGDAVLPQAIVKHHFGELALRGDGPTFDIHPSWTGNLETTEVPLLGTVTCHRAIIPTLTDAMQTLVDRGLGHVVDPEGYRGCWNPRSIAGREALSRHAWGIALDINYPGNETGLGATQPPELVEVMADHGFTWGGPWLIPDPAHFEWVGP